ncbi:MAG: hypothetical protein U5R31_06410 [Acidimicrobiia bacterium]|nr:hypothetical protein [Acidimicrobiia bacterium]
MSVGSGGLVVGMVVSRTKRSSRAGEHRGNHIVGNPRTLLIGAALLRPPVFSPEALGPEHAPLGGPDHVSSVGIEVEVVDRLADLLGDRGRLDGALGIASGRSPRRHAVHRIGARVVHMVERVELPAHGVQVDAGVSTGVDPRRRSLRWDQDRRHGRTGSPRQPLLG